MSPHPFPFAIAARKSKVIEGNTVNINTFFGNVLVNDCEPSLLETVYNEAELHHPEEFFVFLSFYQTCSWRASEVVEIVNVRSPIEK